MTTPSSSRAKMCSRDSRKKSSIHERFESVSPWRGAALPESEWRAPRNACRMTGGVACRMAGGMTRMVAGGMARVVAGKVAGFTPPVFACGGAKQPLKHEAEAMKAW